MSDQNPTNLEILKAVASGLLPGEKDLDAYSEAVDALGDFLRVAWIPMARILCWVLYPLAVLVFFGLVKLHLRRRAAARKSAISSLRSLHEDDL